MESDGYADGGVTDDRNVESILSKLSDQQLTDARNAALQDRDQAKLQMIDSELAERASMRHGLASIPVDFSAYTPDEENYANGGIVAFAAPTEDNNYSLVSDPMGTGAAEIAQSASPTGRSFLGALTNEPEWKTQHRREQEEKAQKPAKKFTEKDMPPATPEEQKLLGSNSAPSAVASPSVSAGPARSISDAARIVTDVAKTQVPKDDVNKLYEDIAKKLNDAPRPEAEALARMLDKAEKRSEEIKTRGVAEALMKFGFGMAAGAAKPGQARRPGLGGMLEAAASASPILAESMAENQKLQAAAEDNALKLRLENARYQSAMEQGNRQLAASLAGSISQRNLQQATLEEQIRQHGITAGLEERKLDIMRAQASRPGSAMEMAYHVVKNDPANKGKTDSELLTMAAESVGAASMYRTDITQKRDIGKEIAKLRGEDTGYKLMKLRAESPNISEQDRAKYQSLLKDKENEYIRQARINLGVTGAGSVGSGTSGSQKGWAIEPIAGGQ
jgi:predicted GNAT family acetyltransferase